MFFWTMPKYTMREKTIRLNVNISNGFCCEKEPSVIATKMSDFMKILIAIRLLLH